MSLVVQEWEARIALIRSIAHSQEAMARILGSIADVAEHSPHLAKSIRDNIQSLNALQLSMAETVTGVRLKRTRLGRPAQPLLRHGVYAPAKVLADYSARSLPAIASNEQGRNQG